MSYEETQHKLQFKRKVQRKREQLISQKLFVGALRQQYRKKSFSDEFDRARVLDYLGDLEHHLEYSISRWERFLNVLRGN